MVFPVSTFAQGTKPRTPELQEQREAKKRQDEARRVEAIHLVQRTAAEAPLWNDKKTAVSVLADAADLLWEETPGQGANWLTRAWTLTADVSDSPRDDRLKEFFTSSDRSSLRTVVLSVAHRHDARLAEKLLKQLAEGEADEKKGRGAFDDRTARSEQLLGLAQQAVDSDPELCFMLAQRSLADGISQSLQNVLTSLRKKNVDLSNRLFDLALSRFAGAYSDPSEAEVLAGYLFRSGFTFSGNSTGQTILVVNPAQQDLPPVAPSEPQRAGSFLVAVYQVLLTRPVSMETPEGRQMGQRIMILGNRLAGPYLTYAPEVALDARGFLAQLQSRLAMDGTTGAADRTTASTPKSERTGPSPTGKEIYENYLAALEDKADQETNPIAKKLAYVEAALAARPEDYQRAKRTAEKIVDPELLADTVSFVLYRAALFFMKKADVERAIEIAPQISKVSRRAVVNVAIARHLLAAKPNESEPGNIVLTHQRAFDYLNDVERDLKKEEPSINSAKLLLGRTAVLATFDRDQALASLGQIVQLLNKLDTFDLRDSAAPNLGLGSFVASGSTVAGAGIGFDFRSAVEPLIMTDFEQVSAAAANLTAKEMRGVGRLEVAKLYLKRSRDLASPVAAKAAR